jgi:uncharacterized protein (UPF0128 family)
MLQLLERQRSGPPPNIGPLLKKHKMFEQTDRLGNVISNYFGKFKKLKFRSKWTLAKLKIEKEKVIEIGNSKFRNCSAGI